MRAVRSSVTVCRGWAAAGVGALPAEQRIPAPVYCQSAASSTGKHIAVHCRSVSSDQLGSEVLSFMATGQ